jgi:hypothetical protein
MGQQINGFLGIGSVWRSDDKPVNHEGHEGPRRFGFAETKS